MVGWYRQSESRTGCGGRKENSLTSDLDYEKATPRKQMYGESAWWYSRPLGSLREAGREDRDGAKGKLKES